jgi:hypothetical protein
MEKPASTGYNNRMLFKVITGNAIILVVGLLLWALYDYAGVPFALGAVFGSLMWHLAYRLHTGGWD